MLQSVRPSVRSSVCPAPDPNSVLHGAANNYNPSDPIADFQRGQPPRGAT